MVIRFAAAAAGTALVLLVLWDAFETVVLPRRVTRRYRLTRLFYRYTWLLWSSLVRSLSKARRQETYYSIYGPLSLILLLCIWAAGVIAGFALVMWSSGTVLKTTDSVDFFTFLYLSGTTFFTLGLGDVAPISPLARLLTVIEPAIGLGLLALVIGYLPSLNQSFSHREINISLLDARAGSPPTASEMLRRQCRGNATDVLLLHLAEWERWAAELLESHLSYPVLAYFRSQHDNQSWLSALTSILDICSLVMSGMEGACAKQAQLTYAIARHTIVDLSLVFNVAPRKMRHDRLPPAEFARLREILEAADIELRKEDDVELNLTELRSTYEPYVASVSFYLRLTIPPWIPASVRRDNWQTSVWEKGTGKKAGVFHGDSDDHA